MAGYYGNNLSLKKDWNRLLFYHKFAEQGSTLSIKLARYSNECVVTIIDDGIGLPDTFDVSTSSNLGLQIVRTLTENELKGLLTLTSTDLGTTAILRFPL